MVPTPGKKFMIIRLEGEPTRNTPSQTFEQISKSTGAEVVFGDDEVGIGLIASPSGAGKKKKSLLDKVIAFSAQVGQTPVSIPDDGLSLKSASRTGSWDEASNARREAVEARVRSPPLENTSSIAAIASADSTPILEEPTNPFRFILALAEPTGPPQERILTEPQLPMSVQNAIKLPPRVSSLAASSSVIWPPAPSEPPPPPPPANALTMTGSQATISGDEGSDTATASEDATDYDSAPRTSSPTISERSTERIEEISGKPVRVSGYNAVYAGRSLAEWALVVAECNHFAERRRQEGVTAYKNIEVPALVVDGFQGIGG